uniref:Uncharacterized protein n=1 Tax=Sphaerodactylus townsendi TaxID=933632 RepID=A0ACB8F2V4_9SAUR
MCNTPPRFVSTQICTFYITLCILEVKKSSTLKLEDITNAEKHNVLPGRHQSSLPVKAVCCFWGLHSIRTGVCNLQLSRCSWTTIPIQMFMDYNSHQPIGHGGRADGNCSP